MSDVDTSVLIELKGFINPLVACYANSLLQCLFNIQLIKDKILASENSELKELLLKYTDNRTKNLDATKIRLQFIAVNLLNVQQDPSELFVQLAGHPDTNYLYDLCAFDVITKKKCSDGMKTESMKATTLYLNIPPNRNSYNSTMTMHDLLQYNLNEAWRIIDDSKCPDGRHPYTQTIYGNFSSIIIFVLQLAHREKSFLPIQKITDFKLNNVAYEDIVIGTKTYELNSAIFHHGFSLKFGHYTAILKRDGHFIRVNDLVLGESLWPLESKDVYMLIYTEITYS